MDFTVTVRAIEDPLDAHEDRCEVKLVFSYK